MSDIYRPTVDETFFRVAYLWAARSTCPKLHVGAVLARGSRTLSIGYNGAPVGMPHCTHAPDHPEPCKFSVHAEANALISAGSHGTATERASLYTTHSPCRACAGLIINAGIAEVIYAERFRSPTGAKMLANTNVRLRRWEGVSGE